MGRDRFRGGVAGLASKGNPDCPSCSTGGNDEDLCWWWFGWKTVGRDGPGWAVWVLRDAGRDRGDDALCLLGVDVGVLVVAYDDEACRKE